jgi:hypothetical protein
MIHLAFAVAAALALPKYWTVHIDTPRADVREAFEKTDVDYFGAIRSAYVEAHLEPPPIVIFTAGGAYYCLRPRTSLADIEKPPSLSDESRKRLSERTAPISERTHALLATHHNEIWQTDNDMTSIASAAAPHFAKLRTESVPPSKQSAYDDVIKRVKAACEKKGVGILACWSAYGDGAYRYLFVSDNPVDLRATLGRELLAQWRACVTDIRELDAKPRPDLTSTDAARWLAP